MNRTYTTFPVEPGLTEQQNKSVKQLTVDIREKALDASSCAVAARRKQQIQSRDGVSKVQLIKNGIIIVLLFYHNRQMSWITVAIRDRTK